jgi:membrane-bound metal-dependent hydrolase YbcI (DUF457 family)
MSHSGEIAAAITGAISVKVAKVLGLISLSMLYAVMESFIIGAIGATGGYLAKKTLDCLVKLYKQKQQKKHEKTVQ